MSKKIFGVLITRNFVFTSILLAIVVFIVYGRLTQTFYQQDEWQGYGLYLADDIKSVFQNIGSGAGLVFGQGRALSNFIYYLFFKFFPLNAMPFAIFSLIFHLLNSILLFLLIRKVFKKTLPAFFGTLFFVLNSVSQNAITWAAAAPGTLPATTLIILSVFTFFEFIEKRDKKWLVLMFIFLYISLFFKEMSIYLFLYLPLAFLFFEKPNPKIFLISFWPFLLFFLASSLFRVLEFRAIPTQEALFLTGSTSNYWQTLLTRAILYPLTSFSLTFVPPEPFLWFARSLTKIYYPFIMPQQFILFAQTAVLDLLSLCLTFLILTFTSIFLKSSNRQEKNYVIFFIGFLFFSFMPYILISKNYAYLESRYYYLPSLAGGVILAWLFIKITEIIDKTKIYLLKPLIFAVFVSFLFFHLKYLEKSISNDVAIAKERTLFLVQLNQFLPRLEGNRNVFYIDSDAEYYVSGNKVPFQQGMGYTLMTIYYKDGKIPKSFLRESFLFEIGINGYVEKSGLGFGYFSDSAKLEEAIAKHKIEKKFVHAFYYDSNKKLLSRSLTP